MLIFCSILLYLYFPAISPALPTTSFFLTHRINVALVSVIEVDVQMLLGVEGLAAQAAGPLRRPVLVLRFLLRPEDIPALVERAFQRQFYLILLQYWHPSLEFRRNLLSRSHLPTTLRDSVNCRRKLSPSKRI